MIGSTSVLGSTPNPPSLEQVQAEYIQSRACDYRIAINEILRAWASLAEENVLPDFAELTSIHRLPFGLPQLLLRGMFERVQLPDRDPATGDRDRRRTEEIMEDKLELKAALVALSTIFPNANIDSNDIALATLLGGSDFEKRMGPIIEAINAPQQNAPQ